MVIDISLPWYRFWLQGKKLSGIFQVARLCARRYNYKRLGCFMKKVKLFTVLMLFFTAKGEAASGYSDAYMKHLRAWLPLTKDPQTLIQRDAWKRTYEFSQIQVDNDVSDFSWEKVVFVSADSVKNNQIYPIEDVSKWKEDSRFIEFQPHKMKISNAHWPDMTIWSPPVPFIAAFWLIVKSKKPLEHLKNPSKDGHKRYYARFFGYLHSRHANKFRREGKNTIVDFGGNYFSNAANLLDNIGFGHELRYAPLLGFAPQGGEVVGFMATGVGGKLSFCCGPEKRRPITIKAKTNIVWYRLPSRDGKVKGAVVGCYSSVDSLCVNGQRGTNFQGRAVAASTEPTSPPASPAQPSTTATTPAPTPAATTAAQPAPTDCRSLRIQIPELQRRLDEQMKAYRGKRQKKWLGLKRNSCKNVRLCETLANAIHLAANNPSMASRLDHYKKQFGKNCKDFERCRAIAAEIERIRKDLDASVRAYNQNCRG